MQIEQLLDGLNEQQRLAVETIDGPVLVVAGPGTGKTQMLAVRIANILAKTDAGPRDILCLTFTESGVQAMRQRLVQLIGPTAYQLAIHTFHSFCNEVILQNPIDFGFARNATQLSDASRYRIVRELIDQLIDEGKQFVLIPFRDKYYYVRDIIDAIQELKREGVSPSDLADFASQKLAALQANPQLGVRSKKPTQEWQRQIAQTEKLTELAQLYDAYQTKLYEESQYDYDDMINFVVKGFDEQSELLARYQEQFLYILVDEYQDTNGSQNKLVRMLGSHQSLPNIFVVGDDDQAIYRFQGANLENILGFVQAFPDCKVISVNHNYRSGQHILDAAGKIVGNNQTRLVNIIPKLDKQLVAKGKSTLQKVQVHSFAETTSENKFILTEVQKLLDSGVPGNEIAVLYRKHAQAEELAQLATKSRIAINIASGADALTHKVIEQLITMLTAINYEGKLRDAALFRFAYYDFANLDKYDVFCLTRFASDSRRSLFEVMLDTEALTEAGVRNPMQLSSFAYSLIDAKASSANMPLSDWLQQLINDTGLLDSIFVGGQTDVLAVLALQKFLDFVKNTFSAGLEPTTVAQLLFELDLMKENRLGLGQLRLPGDTNAVTFATAHGSKGKEYQYVFIYKASSEHWNTRGPSAKITIPTELFAASASAVGLNEVDLDSEDERRLFFVALTRAKQQAIITYAKQYDLTKDKVALPALFVGELDPAAIETIEHPAEEFDPNYARLTLQQVRPDLDAAERQFLTEQVAKLSLSASSLNTFLACPLRFKFEHLIKVPRPVEPILQLGSLIHAFLEQVFRSGEIYEQSATNLLGRYLPPLADKLVKDVQVKQQLLAEAGSILTAYFANYIGEEFLPVAALEYGFYRQSTNLPLAGGNSVRLTGKIDKLEWLDHGANKVRLVDYKSGKPKSRNEIMGKTANSTGDIFRQLVFYQLLSEVDDYFRPSKGAAKFDLVESQVDFLQPNPSGKFVRESFVIEESDVLELKGIISKVVDAIRKLEFAGTDEFPLCGECEFCKMK